MRDLNDKMEQITGKKPTKAEKQRQEILDQRKQISRAEKESRSFAYDLLQEFKALNKRLFIIIVVILALWFTTIAGFMWYLNQYDFSSTTIDAMQDGNGVNMVGGGDVTNGAESTNNNQEANP